MLAARAGAAPAIDDSGLVMGLVSAHELLARKAILTRPGRVLRPGLRHRREHGEVAAPTASRLMISRPAKIRADATTEEAARLMCRHRVTSAGRAQPGRRRAPGRGRQRCPRPAELPSSARVTDARCPSRSAMAVLAALEHRSCACTIGWPEAATRDSGGPFGPVAAGCPHAVVEAVEDNGIPDHGGVPAATGRARRPVLTVQAPDGRWTVQPVAA